MSLVIVFHSALPLLVYSQKKIQYVFYQLKILIGGLTGWHLTVSTLLWWNCEIVGPRSFIIKLSSRLATTRTRPLLNLSQALFDSTCCTVDHLLRLIRWWPFFNSSHYDCITGCSTCVCTFVSVVIRVNTLTWSVASEPQIIQTIGVHDFLFPCRLTGTLFRFILRFVTSVKQRERDFWF